MCGIVGLVGQNDVNLALYDALTMLQHRGQDAAGIATCDGLKLAQRKDVGLVKDVFRAIDMERLKGNMGIGHCRYPTAGSSGPALAQPFYVNSPYGISIAHNGNLTNETQLREELFRADMRHLNTDSDSEVLLNVFAHELQATGKLSPEPDDFFAAVGGVFRRARGGFAVLHMIVGHGILAYRDPNGIRPLVFGYRDTEAGREYMVASESVALDVAGFKRERDVQPGEAIFISSKGEFHSKVCADPSQIDLRPCIFEHVYFARPDSIMDNISVYKARLRQGEKLAEKIRRERPDHDIDVVIPIPDSSRVAAQILAHNLNVKFREGLVKNRYIGRTFIMPGQKERKKSVRQKLNPIRLEFEGKNVLLVDDSIVRGTTSQQIIQMAREAGANKVYFASAAPAVRYPNVYGIDMPTPQELVAHGRSDKEIEKEIGVDWLIYQDIDDLIAASQEGNEEVKHFDCAVFDGDYVTGDVTGEYLDEIARKRSDKAKRKKKGLSRQGNAMIGIFNG